MLKNRISTGHLWMSLLLLASTTTAMAQSGNKFGLKAGVSFSNLRGEGQDVSDKDMRTSVNAGIYGRLFADQHFGLQAELLYSGKGTTVKYNGLLPLTSEFKLSYLELPVFAVIGIGDVLEIHAGAYAAYLLSSNVITETVLGTYDADLDRDSFQGADYGLMIGAGANLGRAQLGVRYLHGMAKLAASNTANLFLGDSRNSTLQVYLAVALNRKD